MSTEFIKGSFSRLLNKEEQSKQRFSDISSPAGLDHGMTYIQQNLHFLLHQADQAREAYGPETIEYDTLISRIANQLAAYGKGGNFTMEELMHYDEKHTRTMRDARKTLAEVTGIPLETHINGFSWTTVTSDLGNAQGDMAGDMPPRGMGGNSPGARFSKLDMPRSPELERPKYGGMELYTNNMTSKARDKSHNDTPFEAFLRRVAPSKLKK